MAAALALTRLMQSLLFGVKATDALTFAAIPLVLVVIALLTSLIPPAAPPESTQWFPCAASDARTRTR